MEVIGKGKNIDQAIQNALAELNAKFEDVDVEVLSEGGFLKKAEVRVTLSQTEEKTEALQPVEKTEKASALTAQKTELKKTEEKLTSVKSAVPEKTKIESKKEKQDFPEKQKREIKPLEGKHPATLFMEEFLSVANYPVTVEQAEKNSEVYISVSGERLGNIIGAGGECISALQYILNLVSARKTEENRRVYLDIGNYKQARVERLSESAIGQAKQVLETGRPYKMKFMSAYERRIVHSAITDIEGVETKSIGVEPQRYIIISKKQG